MREELLHAIAREHCLELSDDDRVRRCLAEKGRDQRRLQASHDGLEFFDVVVGILCTCESHENALLKHSINGKLPDWFRLGHRFWGKARLCTFEGTIRVAFHGHAKRYFQNRAKRRAQVIFGARARSYPSNDREWCPVRASRHIGSSPLALMTATAAGDDRNLISALTASDPSDVAGTAALNTIACWISGGSGVASTPATAMSSGICWAAISTSPLATSSATKPRRTKVDFAFIASAILRRSSRLTMKTPLSAPSLRANDFAARSIRLNASTEPMSGLGAPARTAMPMLERTRSTRRASLPSLIRSPAWRWVRKATSGVSPFWMRATSSHEDS